MGWLKKVRKPLDIFRTASTFCTNFSAKYSLLGIWKFGLSSPTPSKVACHNLLGGCQSVTQGWRGGRLLYLKERRFRVRVMLGLGLGLGVRVGVMVVLVSTLTLTLKQHSLEKDRLRPGHGPDPDPAFYWHPSQLVVGHWHPKIRAWSTDLITEKEQMELK